MAKRSSKVPAKSGYTDTRFNATKYGILSRHTVLPWEDSKEYRELHEALIAEYTPDGPTEGHLVEEVAGIIWRKQRLRMAEAGAARDSLDQLVSEYRQSEEPSLIDTDLFNTEKKAIEEELLKLVAITPNQAEAKMDVIKKQLTNKHVENKAELEAQRNFLKRYREMHEVAQSIVAAGSGYEKIARYETQLDRKLERTLTMLLRIQEFRNRPVAVGSE